MLWLGIEPGAADGSTELFINPGIKPRMALIKISFIAPAPLANLYRSVTRLGEISPL